MDLHRVAACCAAAALGIGVPIALASPALAGGGCHAAREEGSTEATGDTVTLVGNCMTPTILHTDVGTTVTFVNEDPVQHNLYGVGWGTDTLPSGERFTQTFDEAGTYAYACTIHPGMVGAVEVGGGAGSVAAVEAPATLPVSSESSSSDDGDGGLGAAGVGAVAVVAFAAGAGAVAARRRVRTHG